MQSILVTILVTLMTSRVMCSPASSRDHSYQYDQPDYDVYDDDDEGWENEEAPYETDAEILTEPMTVTVTRGDSVKLPCEVKSKGK